MLISRFSSNFFLTAVTGLTIALPAVRTIALTVDEVDAIAWQVSVLISPNLTAKGDRLLIEGTKTGSGVIISREEHHGTYTYYVLTAFHVVAKRGGVHAIAMPDGAVYAVDADPNSDGIVYLGEFAGDLGERIQGWDLAMLKFDSDRDYPVASIATTPPTPGAQIFINGWPNPDNLTNTNRDRRLTAGHVRELVNPPQADGGYSLLYTNRTESGMSGGPIFNAQGQLVGIHGRGRGIENGCSSAEVNQTHSCGMPLSNLRQELDSLGFELPLNHHPVSESMIQYGLSYRSQSDRIRPNQWPLNTLGHIGPMFPLTSGNSEPVELSETSAPVNRDRPPSESSRSAPVYYVNPQEGNNHATAGKTPENPFQSISYLLQSSLPSGTVIHLAPGLYNSSTETFPLKLPSGVILRGHPLEAVNDRQPIREVLIIGGDFTQTRGWGQQNATIVAGGTSEMTGVTVSNPMKHGTGIWIEAGSPTIAQSTLHKNNREGIFIGGQASPTIVNNRFVENVSNGISIADRATGDIRDNLFEMNEFGIAIAGDAAPTITNNQVRDRRVGIAVTERARPSLHGNILENHRDYGLLVLSANLPALSETNQIRGSQISDRLMPPIDEWGLPLPPELAPSLVFGCLDYEAGLATWVYNGHASIPQPMILWPPELLQPTNRCDSVAGKLNGISAKIDNPLDNLFLKTGRINDSQVVCWVSDWQSSCERDNMLFPLPNNPRWAAPTELLRELLVFSVAAPGNPVQEVGVEAIAPLKGLNERLRSHPGLWFVE